MVCVCVCVCAGTLVCAQAHYGRLVEDNLEKFVLCFHKVGSWNGTQAVRFNGKSLSTEPSSSNPSVPHLHS